MGDLRVEFYADVLERVREAISGSPEYEVGGKLVGWVEGDRELGRSPRGPVLSRLHIVVGGFIDDGPLADRSAVHHFSDNEYQFRVYQRLIQDHPDVEFIGIWHSHHPNGYGTLSAGDVDTGHSLANNPQYPLNVVLSSLALDKRGLTDRNHYLFIRGVSNVLRVPPASIVVKPGQSPLGRALRLATDAVLADSNGRPGSQGAATGLEAGTATSSGDGREQIAFDNSWLRDFPWLKPFQRRGTVVWKGETTLAGHRVTAAYAYQSGYDSPPVILLSDAGSELVLKASLPEPGRRPHRMRELLDWFRDALERWHGPRKESWIEGPPEHDGATATIVEVEEGQVQV